MRFTAGRQVGLDSKYSMGKGELEPKSRVGSGMRGFLAKADLTWCSGITLGMGEYKKLYQILRVGLLVKLT